VKVIVPDGVKLRMIDSDLLRETLIVELAVLVVSTDCAIDAEADAEAVLVSDFAVERDADTVILSSGLSDDVM